MWMVDDRMMQELHDAMMPICGVREAENPSNHHGCACARVGNHQSALVKALAACFYTCARRICVG
jgi:hypothetical protein